MIEWKGQLLARTPAGQAVLERDHYKRIGGDVRTINLGTAVEVGRVMVVVAEGLLMYLDTTAQRELFARISTLLRGAGGQLIFDLVPPAEEPPPGLLGRLLGVLMRKATRGADFVRERRTRQDILADLNSAGFHAEAVEPHAVAAELSLPYPSTWTRQVVFRATRPASPEEAAS